MTNQQCSSLIMSVHDAILREYVKLSYSTESAAALFKGVLRTNNALIFFKHDCRVQQQAKVLKEKYDVTRLDDALVDFMREHERR